MNIQKEIQISKYQKVSFAENTELGELYDAMREYWRLDRDHCEVFKASIFYSLGRVHGIREERARRKR